ncbi:MAG: hypothetical protein KKD48_00050, partial [Nanoarchaeota archaeon]|nr:hypothetical protein [Nanoarchaeota archaeon]
DEEDDEEQEEEEEIPIGDVEVTDDEIIIELTVDGIEARIRLILENVGLLKKKPKLSIEFTSPEILGEVKNFRLFDWLTLLIYLIIITLILFLTSYRGYLKYKK